MKIAFLAALPAFAAIASGAAVPQDVSAAAVPARFWDKPNFQGQRFDGVRGVCKEVHPHNVISSIKIPAGWVCSLYDATNCGKLLDTFVGPVNVADLPPKSDNQAASIRC